MSSSITSRYYENILNFKRTASIPTDYDPKEYYFIGAMIALSCSVFSGAIIVITTMVRIM